MCGINAFFSRGGNSAAGRLDVPVGTLYHRGPDNRNVWVSPDGEVALGHARLSIIDLAGGTQPLADESGRLHLVVNGELYGYEAIRAEYEARGYRFRTQSDSEIVLPLYRDYGANCVTRLRGEFAFALWDERFRMLFAARDRFGIKPLFYAVHEGDLYLASEVKALFAAGVPAVWDEASLRQFHTTWTPFPTRTFFRGVHQVPPGHYLIATRDDIRIHSYWDFEYATEAELEKNAPPFEDAVAGVREQLETAVRLRLRADVPVGCYLSGGLDSCSLLGFASRLVERPIKAFTLSFAHEAYDEAKVAAEMARRAGAEYEPIAVTARDMADAFADAVWHAEIPLGNPHAVAKYLLSRRVRDAGYRVVLTGEGSDEIFGGYAHFRRDMLLYDRRGQTPEEVEALLATLAETNQVSRGFVLPHGTAEGVEDLRRVLGFVPSFLENNALAGARMLPLIRRELREEWGGDDGFLRLLNELPVAQRLAGRGPVHQSMYLWSRLLLNNYLLVALGDRMEMAHSVEGRVPFLDHHLVEYVQRLPVSYKIRGLNEKYVLREAARPVITDTVYRRQKHPFLAPPSAIDLDNPMYALLNDVLRGPALRNVPFYDADAIVALLDELPRLTADARAAMDPVLTGILSVVLLQQRFGLGG